MCLLRFPATSAELVNGEGKRRPCGRRISPPVRLLRFPWCLLSHGLVFHTRFWLRELARGLGWFLVDQSETLPKDQLTYATLQGPALPPFVRFCRLRLQSALRGTVAHPSQRIRGIAVPRQVALAVFARRRVQKGALAIHCIASGLYRQLRSPCMCELILHSGSASHL
jgi:hypothetical protein